MCCRAPSWPVRAGPCCGWCRGTGERRVFSQPSRGLRCAGRLVRARPRHSHQVDSSCARSDQNYPSILAASKKWRLTDVSCSPARTAALTGSQGSLTPQVEALTRRTDVVTVTVGGKDLGFSNNPATCAKPAATDPTGNPCQAFFTGDGTDQPAEQINNITSNISSSLQEIRRRAPRAKVVVVGHPDLFPDNGVGCTAATVPLAAGDFACLRDTEKKLNDMPASQAHAGGARYIDTYTPTIGHDMCRPAG
ncbi:SGNH/GDSL hydrolase family protein [Streptomyces sp. NPDC050619]|uniref:SGNH/GDSL hydrolase family protein n=1 Tax=Streptomyces sp. NPDC050619 TaxID=3157214 RepID=UPI003437F1C2